MPIRYRVTVAALVAVFGLTANAAISQYADLTPIVTAAAGIIFAAAIVFAVVADS